LHVLGQPDSFLAASYKGRFGDDYFAFWAGGCRCLVVNSSLHAAQEPALWEDAALGLGVDGKAETEESVARDRAEAESMVRATWCPMRPFGGRVRRSLPSGAVGGACGRLTGRARARQRSRTAGWPRSWPGLSLSF
jgi:hypothetical protein